MTKMWSDSVSLDNKGSLKFLMVSKNNLELGSTYQLSVILSSRSLFKINDALSVLTFDGNTLSYSITNTTTQTEAIFTFSPTVSKNIYQF